MEIQSAFMGAAAAAVLLVAVLVQSHWRASALLAALIASYGSWALARGATSLGAAWGPTVRDVSLVAIGLFSVVVAGGFAGWTERLRRAAPLLLAGSLTLAAAVLVVRTFQTQFRLNGF